MSNTTCSC